MPKTTDSKAIWRDWAKQRRAQLVNGAVSEAVCKQLQTSPLFQKAEHVLSYLAFGAELDLAALHESSDKTFYVTRTWMKPEPRLSIHRLTDGLERHAFGYWQPRADVPEVPPEGIDLALVPGLVFDRQGARLGYGMGFYDRLLPLLRSDCPRVGVTPAALWLPQLPSDDFDVPMTHIVTEQGLRSLADVSG